MLADRTTTILLVTILLLITVLLIFAMRVFGGVRQAQIRAASEGAYRELAAAATSAQTTGAAALVAVQTDLAEIKTRLASVERVLKEVE